MKSYLSSFIVFCILGSIFAAAGCQQSSTTDSQQIGHGHDHGHEHGHDHSGRPKSLRAAIEELREIGDELRTAMEADDAKAAHEPLHHVGKLLKSMPDLAADTDLPKDDWDAIKKEVDRLFEAFGDVDAAFHKKDGDKQAAYDAAKSTIDEGVAALQAFLPKLGESTTPAKHDHDEHDHGEHAEGEHDEHEGHDHDEDDHDDDAKTE